MLPLCSGGSYPFLRIRQRFAGLVSAESTCWTSFTRPWISVILKTSRTERFLFHYKRYITFSVFAMGLIVSLSLVLERPSTTRHLRAWSRSQCREPRCSSAQCPEETIRCWMEIWCCLKAQSIFTDILKWKFDSCHSKQVLHSNTSFDESSHVFPAESFYSQWIPSQILCGGLKETETVVRGQLCGCMPPSLLFQLKLW